MRWLADAAPTTGETARRIVLGERTVDYVLRRAKRRTIGLSVDHRGLRVGAPVRATLREIEALLRRHGEWIVDKLDTWQARRDLPLLRLVDGLRLPFLGRSLTLHLALGANRGVWGAHAGEPTLTLCLRAPDAAPRVLEKLLREKARHLFLERLAHYGPRLGVAPPPLALSSARTRWGSCSSRGGIRLNWRLIHFPLPVVAYVVAHELAHLREMNHGPRFWSIVAGLYPDYRAARRQLRELAPQCPYWQGESA